MDVHLDAGQLDEEEPDDLVIGGAWTPSDELARSDALDRIYRTAGRDHDSPLDDVANTLSAPFGEAA